MSYNSNYYYQIEYITCEELGEVSKSFLIPMIILIAFSSSSYRPPSSIFYQTLTCQTQQRIYTWDLK